jgi:phosphatidylglycerol:prolipoprotein diacylglycerol transferase
LLNDIYQGLDPVAFSVGPFVVRWYGLGYVFGFLLAALLTRRVAKLWKIEVSWDALLTILIACMLGTIIGGRAGYILFYDLGKFVAHPDQILAFSRGGMSFHGGLIGFAIGLVIAARILKVPLLTLGDLASITSPIGLGLVRVANFINGELWGSVTDLPWGVVFHGGGPLPRHPTQLYEAMLEGVALLAILYMLARRKPTLPRGSYFGVFLVGYGVFRIAVEFVRMPDAHIGYLLGTEWVTMGMLLTLPMVIGGALLLAWSLRRQAPQVGEVAQAADADADEAEPGETDGDIGEGEVSDDESPPGAGGDAKPEETADDQTNLDDGDSDPLSDDMVSQTGRIS